MPAPGFPPQAAPPYQPAPYQPVPGGAPPGQIPPGGWQQPIQQPRVPQGALASWGTRLGAYLIDGLVIWLPAIIILAILGGGVASTNEGSGGFGALVGGLILTVLVVVVISIIYAPLLMSRPGERNGQTWGKQVLNIRVVRDNGQPYTFGPAALREVVLKALAVGVASSIIPVIPWFLNFFWPLWDDENRALHDMGAQSHVVKA